MEQWQLTWDVVASLRQLIGVEHLDHNRAPPDGGQVQKTKYKDWTPIQRRRQNTNTKIKYKFQLIGVEHLDHNRAPDGGQIQKTKYKDKTAIERQNTKTKTKYKYKNQIQISANWCGASWPQGWWRAGLCLNWTILYQTIPCHCPSMWTILTSWGPNWF